MGREVKEGSEQVEPTNEITININFSYESAKSYVIDSNDIVYVYNHWDMWPTFSETSKLSDSSLTYTTTDLISGSTYEYSVYVVQAGTTLTEDNCNGYWLIDGSFTNDGSLSVISTLTIDDNLLMSIVIFLPLPSIMERKSKQFLSMLLSSIQAL